MSDGGRGDFRDRDDDRKRTKTGGILKTGKRRWKSEKRDPQRVGGSQERLRVMNGTYKGS